MRSKGDGTGAATPKDSGLALKVAVIRARNLAAKDRGGTSDPVGGCCRLFLGVLQGRDETRSGGGKYGNIPGDAH